MTKAAFSSWTRSELNLVTSHTVIGCQVIRLRCHTLIQKIEIFRCCPMALTWNEVEFVGNVYSPSLGLWFFCVPSVTIPKAKEWKLIQLKPTNMTMAVILFSKCKDFIFPCSQYLAVLFLVLAAGIGRWEQALGRVFWRGPKLINIERPISANMVKLCVLHSGPNFATCDEF